MMEPEMIAPTGGQLMTFPSWLRMVEVERAVGVCVDGVGPCAFSSVSFELLVCMLIECKYAMGGS